VTPKPYTEVVGLEHVYLEDSYVLDIEAHPGSLFFKLDLVLTPEHSMYAPPKPHEQYCFRPAELRFERVRRITWENSGLKPATDATGEVDYGNIDSYNVIEGRHVLSGEWGSIDVDCQDVKLLIRAEEA
jgi:hypothetical protein